MTQDALKDFEEYGEMLRVRGPSNHLTIALAERIRRALSAVPPVRGEAMEAWKRIEVFLWAALKADDPLRADIALLRPAAVPPGREEALKAIADKLAAQLDNARYHIETLDWNSEGEFTSQIVDINSALDEYRAYLAAPVPPLEPVGWVSPDFPKSMKAAGTALQVIVWKTSDADGHGIPLYLSPPQQESEGT